MNTNNSRATLAMLIAPMSAFAASPSDGTGASPAVPATPSAQARWDRFVRTEEALYEPHALWADFGAGISYQTIGQKRFSFSSQIGYRYDTSGPFALVEHARIRNFTSKQSGAAFTNLGLGWERLWLLGRFRTSIALGASILSTDTEVDTAGTWGYFFDLRPVSIRWPLGPKFAVWLAPTTLNVSIPVPNGLPLVFINHQTLVGVETQF